MRKPSLAIEHSKSESKIKFENQIEIVKSEFTREMNQLKVWFCIYYKNYYNLILALNFTHNRHTLKPWTNSKNLIFKIIQQNKII